MDECIELLENEKKNIVDDVARLSQLCRLKIAKGDLTAKDIAEKSLINRIPDNEKFHELMHESMQLKESKFVSLVDPPMKRNEEDVARLKTLYDALQTKHAKSSVCKDTRYKSSTIRTSLRVY